MSQSPSLWDGFRLHTSTSKYIFEPISEQTSGKSEALVVDRSNGDLRLEDSASFVASKSDKIINVHGIIGLITLHKFEFLVVITSRTQVARLLGSNIYMATDFRILPVSSDAKPSVLQHPIEKMLLGLLKSHLYSAPFYFSYELDLTSSLQRQQSQDPSLPLWQRADERFFWNRHLQTRLIDNTSTSQNLARFILPCMYGFLEIKPVTVNGHQFIFGLIARRSRHRPGTRYFSRGIDTDGNVSNFNESEQFVILDPTGEKSAVRMSYVQTRGSVPVFWAEVNNLRYKPDLLIMAKPETAEATKKHFDQQVNTYGDIFLVNLVNQKGYEKPVKDAYERAVETLNNERIHYTYYDFHHECKGMKFEKVMDLIARLKQKGLRDEDYFHAEAEKGATPNRTQTSVVRTNCMDCLDRTNVVQSTLGRWMLNTQLRAAGVLGSDDRVEDFPDFMFTFRNVWADHADVVSKAYSGTGALKTDFTRTGKRSKEGALQDGINSVTRYVKNNYFDGARQDAYDLFTGAWDPRNGVPNVDKRALLLRAMPWILLLSLLLTLAAPVLPLASDSVSSRNFIIFWTSIAVVASWYILDRGLEYVSWPTLNRPEEAMYYEGPGFSSGRRGRGAVVGYTGRNSSVAQYREAPTGVGKRNVGRRGQAYSEGGDKTE